MNSEDQLLFSSIVAKSYESAIEEKYGEKGLDHFSVLVGALRGLYANLRFSAIEEIVVYKSDVFQLERMVTSSTTKIVNFQQIAANDYCTLSVQVLSEREIVISESLVDINELLEDTFVYRYCKGEEFFHIKEKGRFRLQKMAGADSCFAISTFKTLDEALDAYDILVARNAKCQFIVDSLYDDMRLYFKSKPEHFLRDSLYGFLNARLRDAEIRVEQNVDATHPVDIKVFWMYTNKQALIEVKWVGASVDPENPTRVITHYGNTRAQSGADQLVDYLNRNRASVPLFDAIGYLVVFDLRRSGCEKEVSLTISREDSLAYERQDLVYDPDYALTRNDFAKPRRFFILPLIP